MELTLDMTARYSTASLLLFLAGLQSTASQSILTCVSPGSAGPRLTCSDLADSIIWVKKAYIALTLSKTPATFCDAPTFDPTRNDCVSSIDDVTDYVNSQCGLYQNCQLTVGYTLPNCTSNYSGFTYLYAEFECLPTKISGVTLPSFTISEGRTAFAQPGLSYFRSDNYPSKYTSQRGACRIQVPANTRATWRLLDLRGRLINLASGCAFLLQIYSRSAYRQWCAQLTWESQQFEIMTGNDAGVLNLNFDPVYGQNSEGKVWISLNLTDSGGNQVNRINVTCGTDILLDIPPETAFSSLSTTTSTTIPSPTTTSSTARSSRITPSLTTTSSTTISTTTTVTSTTTSSTTTNPTTPALTYNPPTTSSTSSPLIFQPSSPVDPVQLSSPSDVTASLSTPLDASRTPTIATENGTMGEYNGTDQLTTATSASNKPDYTVWLIIGLTVGGGLLLIICIVVAIAACGYHKRRTSAQRQGEVIFAWERAETGGATSGVSDDKTSPSSAKPKVNTYCRGPPSASDLYLEIVPKNPDSNATGNSPTDRSTRKDIPPHRANNLNYTGQPRVNARQAKSKTNEDIQINPVYGHLDLTNYILPIDGVETTAAI